MKFLRFPVAVILCISFQLLGENILKNGDFEDGLTGWTTPNWMKTALMEEIDPGENQGPGSGSLKLQGDGVRQGLVMQTIRIKPGANNKFRLTGWMKKSGFQNSWAARIQLTAISMIDNKEQNVNYPLIAPLNLADMDWKEFTLEAVVPETAIYVRVILLTQPPSHPAKPNSGTVWFDNITLEKL